ncbi:hypothetical protein [Brachybacterium fresconis]|uniref:Uncharacterized protein n=1 Tax=Brachybacterium fresconis TaxID=173363 RepID=A0ABS4YIT9_9MICO|nr:hypothetical protein [Brachybacterium fresconis]MBP2408425.1 hypothetical protein [Brachybacterium fresconis]
MSALASAVAAHVLQGRSFGQRAIAMIASIYAIASVLGHHLRDIPSRTGDAVIADALRALDLDGPADWFTDTLFAQLSESVVALACLAAVLAASVISMVSVFSTTMYNATPQASFICLLSLALLIDLEAISAAQALGGMIVSGVLGGIFCALRSDTSATEAAAIGLLTVVSPVIAVVYAPLRAISWLLREPRNEEGAMRIEGGFDPVRVRIVDDIRPTGARIDP